MNAPLASPAVRRFTATDIARWDAFVMAHGDASFFHRAGWEEVIRRAFGHRTHFLLAERGSDIVGILPLVEIRSRLFGHTLSSTPFCVYGGVLASDPIAAATLDQSAQALARELGVDALELRNRVPAHADWPRKGLYVTFRKPIEPELERNMNAIPRKQRAMVRKGVKNGLASEPDRGTERFFYAYSSSVHRLGTPVFSRRYFDLLREVFGPDCDVLTIVRDHEVVASVMSFYFRDEVLPYYGGGTDAARALAANDFMYWEVMRRACERGLRVFDYGRSKVGSGSYDFKKNWGFEPVPLSYEYHLVRAKAVPEVSPNNPKYALFIAAWRRMPLWMANTIGPWLARDLG